MTPAAYREWLRGYASTIGLDPDLAEATWKQESGGGLDTTLEGPDLSRGRGNAIGPWQVVPYYHPKFPVAGDAQAQGQYAMDYLKEVGPAQYYGTGPHPAGHPTTEQYVRQVTGGPDTRMAANRIGSTDTDNTPSGDPRTGRMNQLPPFTMPPQQPEPQRPAMMDWAMPLMSLLAGAAMSSGKGIDRVLSGAGLAGEALSATQTAENELLDLKQKREDARRRRQNQDALSRYAQQLSLNPETAEIGAMMQVDPGAGMAYYAQQRQAQMQAQQLAAQAADYERTTGDAAGAARMRGGYSPGAPPQPAESTLSPQLFQVEGKNMERVYRKDGTFVDRELPGAPMRFDPNVAGGVARATAANTATGRIEGEAQANAESGGYTLASIVDEVERLLPIATSSGVGAARDATLGYLGVSTDNSKAASRLEVLGQRMIMAQPRMEGPQSDADRQNYEKAAGKLADRTIPYEDRLAALETLKDLTSRQRALGNPAFANVVTPGGIPTGRPAASIPSGVTVRRIGD